MKEVKAIHKYAKISAFKVRLIADQIRNKPVEEALNILYTSFGEHSPVATSDQAE